MTEVKNAPNQAPAQANAPAASTAPQPPGPTVPPGAPAPAASPAPVAAPAPPPPPEPPDEATRMLRPSARERKALKRRQLQAILVVARKGIPPADLQLNRPRTVIGRDRDSCDVVLDDEGVSRQHATVTREASGFFVLHDLGSTNGVTVHGQRITRRTLIHGDEFVVGETTFRFQVTSPPPGK